MKFTKTTIIASMLTFLSLGAHAETTCPLEQSTFGLQHGIEKIVLQKGAPGSVSIHFKNGTIENLQPESAATGPFGEIKFLPNMEDSHMKKWLYTQVTSQTLGVIQARSICHFLGSDINCNGFSGGQHSTEDKVQFNFSGEVVSFDGNQLPFCPKK